MTIVDRALSLRRAAEMRAAVTALLNSSNQPLSAKEISEQLKGVMSSLGYFESNLSNFLFNMSANKLISKTGELGHVRYWKYGGEEYSPAKPKAEKTQVKKVTKSTAGLPEIKVDYVKSSGKVRLEIKGLVIEIGVVE